MTTGVAVHVSRLSTTKVKRVRPWKIVYIPFCIMKLSSPKEWNSGLTFSLWFVCYRSLVMPIRITTPPTKFETTPKWIGSFAKRFVSFMVQVRALLTRSLKFTSVCINWLFFPSFFFPFSHRLSLFRASSSRFAYPQSWQTTFYHHHLLVMSLFPSLRTITTLKGQILNLWPPMPNDDWVSFLAPILKNGYKSPHHDAGTPTPTSTPTTRNWLSSSNPRKKTKKVKQPMIAHLIRPDWWYDFLYPELDIWLWAT